MEKKYNLEYFARTMPEWDMGTEYYMEVMTDTVSIPNAPNLHRIPSIAMPAVTRCRYCGVKQEANKLYTCACCGAPL